MKGIFDMFKMGLELFSLWNQAMAHKDYMEENRYLRETVQIERHRSLSMEGQIFAIHNNVTVLADEFREFVQQVEMNMPEEDEEEEVVEILPPPVTEKKTRKKKIKDAE